MKKLIRDDIDSRYCSNKLMKSEYEITLIQDSVAIN